MTSIDMKEEIGSPEPSKAPPPPPTPPTHARHNPTSPIDITPDAIIIEWSHSDLHNPQNWSSARKYILLWTAFATCIITAINCTHVAIVNTAGQERFGISRLEFSLSLTVYLLAIGGAPLFLAPLSETLGRNVIYQATGLISAVLYIPQALTTNYNAFLAARWFQGMAQSVANSMVSGIVADIFSPEDRGRPMNYFVLVSFVGQSLGGAAFGWVVKDLGFQWVYGIQGIAAGIICVLNLLFIRETRSDILLLRRAKQLSKTTGQQHIPRGHDSKQSGLRLIAVSCLRPLQFLFTEPIVSALSAWIGFAWAMIFLGGTSVNLVFQQYGWNIGQLGLAQLPVLIGAVIGMIANDHQELIYRRAAAKHGGEAPPEARLCYAAYGGLCFPLAQFVFAYTGRPSVPWPIPAVALVVSNFGIFTIYAGVLNYLADAYETYSSSAQAAQSLSRNILGAILPLFAYQFFTDMGYSLASTVVASVALFLGIAPFVLLRFGAVLRARSKVASSLRAQPSREVDMEHRPGL